MTIKRFGIIGLTDIQNEFGGSIPIGINEYYRGGAYTSINNSAVPTDSFISINKFYGASKYLPGTTGLLTVSKNFVLPPYCGTTVYYYCIAGGGGGGGGSSRITYNYGAGGGGGTGGNSYGSFSAAPGDALSIIIGGAGTPGAARDGPYSIGSSGGTGGQSQIKKNGYLVVTTNGGLGGAVAQHGYNSSLVTPGGSIGTITSGISIQVGDNGQYGQNGVWWAVGGQGGRGFFPRMFNGAGTFTRGALGTGGIGYYNGYSLARNAVSGTGYGAGGSGGGAMLNANSSTFNGSSGVQGCVLIWW